MNPTAHRPSTRTKGAREAVWPPGALGMARARATVAARACMHARGLAPKCGAPPTHVPSMGPGARGSGRHMGWRRRCSEHLHAWATGRRRFGSVALGMRRCGEHLHAGPWGGGGGRAHHSQSREPLGAIPRLTLVGCPTSLSFLTTVTVASSSSNTPVAEIRNDWRAVDWDTRNGRCAVISGHHGVIMGSSWGHHRVIGHQRSSGFISALISVLTWYASRPVFGGVEGP